MPPRIAYWAGSFEPEMEAVASEVACLRSAFPGSIAWGIDARRWARLSWKRGFSVHPRCQLAFRAVTWMCQRAFHLNHLFGSLGDWFHLKAIARHPTLLTIALPSGAQPSETLLNKVDRFVVEWPAARDELRQQGVNDRQIDLVFPPVDLAKFVHSPKPADPFTVMFASSPERADWLSSRGVDVILEAAALRPDIQFRLIWRPWGDSLPVIKAWIADRGLANIQLMVGRCDNMPAQYEQAHVVAAPFREMERCKPAPNSIVEGLACGRPAIVTNTVGISELIEEQRAGLVVECDGASLAEALDRLRREWDDYSTNARQLAETRFGQSTFLQSYARIYEELV